MSADLLAEFGQPRSPVSEDDKRTGELNSGPLQDNNALISVVLDNNNHAGLRQKKEKGPEELWRRNSNGADVLFDASTDQYDLDDEFGDFEDAKQELYHSQHTDLLHDTASKNTSSVSVVPSQSLLQLEESIDSLQLSKSSESHQHEDEWGDFSTAVSNEEAKQKHTGTRTKTFNREPAAAIDKTAERNDWEPFEDGEAVISGQRNHNAMPIMSHGIHRVALGSRSKSQNLSLVESGPTTAPKDESRPTNIPPPAILLQMLPNVFRKLADMNQAQERKQLCDAILQAYTVASHLIAGRTLRWKRDNILSQSTKIGPAAAGRTGGGMKLAALDKSESLREEREVVEILQAWEKYAHLFNVTVHKSGTRRPMMRLSEDPRPRAAKGAGVLTSQLACALCGLKRDERLPEIHIDVDDSFGEFWVEHWGHRDCKDFWQRNQALLPQR